MTTSARWKVRPSYEKLRFPAVIFSLMNPMINRNLGNYTVTANDTAREALARSEKDCARVTRKYLSFSEDSCVFSDGICGVNFSTPLPERPKLACYVRNR
eukprot:COSAG02_NODE_526_length_20707_cov_11.431337_12_plen_100_part_00